MIQEERLSKIETIINTRQYVSVDDLVNELHVSKATARRDLNILGNRNTICLVRGGAKKKGALEQELPYIEKINRNSEEKIRIGKAAADHIKEGQLIFIDTGTTTREMVQALQQMKNIDVITNDVWIASNLSENVNINLIVPGGSVRKGYFTIRGSETENYLSNIFVDNAFISCDSLDLDFGCSISNNDEVLIKRQMVHNSKKSILLADHSKCETVSGWKVCSINEIDFLITGKELPNSLATYYKNKLELQLV